jgi:phosphohistidine swiveling domain-containing protein
MKKASDYMYLEQVPNVQPLDLLFIDLAHMLINQRPEFGVTDAGSMLLVFSKGSCQLFLEKDKWLAAGKKVLEYTLQSDERISCWEKRIEWWTEHVSALGRLYMNTDFSMYHNASLCAALDSLHLIERINGLQNVEIVSTNYGTNLIHEELEKALKELGFAPHAIIPILLRTTKALAVIEYEKILGETASFVWQKGITKLDDSTIEEDSEVSSKINGILSSFGWLDASFGGEPKSIKSVMRDINDLLSFGSDLLRILSEREKSKTEKILEQTKVLTAVLEKASSHQKRAIVFARKSAELGGVLVDEIMKFIYHRRNIYKECGNRLNISERDAKYLLPEELKDCIQNGSPVRKEIIEERKKLIIFTLENNTYTYKTGLEAEKFHKELLSAIVQDDKPLKGEIAYSAGKVKGIARLVNDVHDMDKVKEGDILVSSRTYPDLLPAMKRSKAIIAELGGLLSHAAIVSRELHIPCVVGVRNATSRIKDGDMLEVDTITGAVSILK